MSESTALLAAAVATAVLASLHALVPVLRRRLSRDGEGIAAAVGGGVAAAYVFIHLLPRLARGNEEIAEVLGERVAPSSLAELTLFVVAFGGFLLLYGLDHLASRRGAGTELFLVHLGAYAAYNALITYALPMQFQSDLGMAVLFVIAMGVHFLASDRALAHHYGERFAVIGRPVLISALVVGSLAAWAFAPTRTTVVSVLLAVLAGFVLYNVFHDELPSERKVRFPAFALSALGYAGLLFAVVVIES